MQIRDFQQLPAEPWQLGKPHAKHSALKQARLRRAVAQATSHGRWTFPDRPVFFISDPHADAAALRASLLATGTVVADQHGFRMTAPGRRARLIIGGDCLDKGPSNLQLLDTLAALRASGVDLTILAGNHDLRLWLGLLVLGQTRSVRSEHLFLRMGPKVVPLLQEVWQRDLCHRPLPDGTPADAECAVRLIPRDGWDMAFRQHWAGLLPDAVIDKECRAIAKKRASFALACQKAGMSMRAVFATAQHCRRLFLEPTGEYGWFFGEMQLARQEGAFLCVHAGLDDQVARQLARSGVTGLNSAFRRALEADPCGFYFGPLANSLRTKYRDTNLPLTADGVVAAHRAGVFAVVHGHRNRLSGQRMMLRQGLLHFEADVTLDRHSRSKEGLPGIGQGALLIDPGGYVLGVSRDYPRAKLFSPALAWRAAQQNYASQQECLPA